MKYKPTLPRIPENSIYTTQCCHSSDEEYLTADEDASYTDDETPIGLYSIYHLIAEENEGCPTSLNTPTVHTVSTTQDSTVIDVEQHPVYEKDVSDVPTPLITLQDIKREQHADLSIREVIGWFKAGERPKCIQELRQPKDLLSYFRQYNSLKLDKEILYRKWLDKNKPDDFRWLIVVPFTLQEQILVQYHSSHSLCHSGVETCLEKCTQKYYWAGMREDFTLYIAGCVKCSQNRQPTRYLRAPLHSMVYSYFGAAVGIDHIIMNNGRPTSRGHTCILSMTDLWSGYVVLANCKGQTKEESINHIIKEWVLRLGIFQQVIHDRGPGFESKLFARICELFDIKNTRTTRYFCKSNGSAEASNKRVGSLLRGVLPRNDLEQWDKYTLLVMSAMNSLKSGKTGFTPNYLLYGRELPLCHEFAIDYGPSDDCKPPPSKEVMANELYRRMKLIYYRVRKFSNAKALYTKKVYDRHARGPYFEAGDYCLVLVEPADTKLAPRFKGPYYVKSKISTSLYLVEKDAEKQIFDLVNIEKMKRFRPSKWTKLKRPPTIGVSRDDPIEQLGPISEDLSSSSDEDEVAIARYAPPVDHGTPISVAERAREVQPSNEQTNPSTPTQPAVDMDFPAVPPRYPRRNPAPMLRWGIHRERAYDTLR